jgi:ribosomal-protein-alanine N-acetyltransferase
MIKIREMTADDVSEVMTIERASFNEPWAETHFYFEIYTKTSENWVAVEDNIILGYLCFWTIADELHINNIAVRKDRRRQGVAQMMLDELYRLGKKHKASMMTLEVNEHNDSAIGFYRKNGFELVGIRPKYYAADQADALIMTKRLETT